MSPKHNYSNHGSIGVIRLPSGLKHPLDIAAGQVLVNLHLPLDWNHHEHRCQQSARSASEASHCGSRMRMRNLKPKLMEGLDDESPVHTAAFSLAQPEISVEHIVLEQDAFAHPDYHHLVIVIKKVRC